MSAPSKRALRRGCPSTAARARAESPRARRDAGRTRLVLLLGGVVAGRRRDGADDRAADEEAGARGRDRRRRRDVFVVHGHERRGRLGAQGHRPRGGRRGRRLERRGGAEGRERKQELGHCYRGCGATRRVGARIDKIHVQAAAASRFGRGFLRPVPSAPTPRFELPTDYRYLPITRRRLCGPGMRCRAARRSGGRVRGEVPTSCLNIKSVSGQHGPKVKIDRVEQASQAELPLFSHGRRG